MTAGIYVGDAKHFSFQRFLSLLGALVYRNVMSRYRKSVLGPAWAIIQPVTYMVIFTFLRGVVQFRSDGIPYPLFAFCALVPWTFLSNAVVTSAPSVIMNAMVVKKIAVPREVFPLSSIMTAGFDFCMAFLVLLGLMFYYGVGISWLALFWVPILFAFTAALAFAVGMVMAAFGTYKRDLVMAAPFFMQFWLFLSPVIYSSKQIPEAWRFLYNLNPAVGLIEGFRNVLLFGQPPVMASFGISVAVTVLLLMIVWPIFRYLSQYFADVV